MNQSIDFQVAIDLSSTREDIQMADDDDVDLYGDLSIVLLANDQPDVLDYFEEISDLSGDEFSEEYSTKAQPAALHEEDSEMSDTELLEECAGTVPIPATPVEGNDKLELSLSEEDLLEEVGEPINSSTRPSSPTIIPATPPTSPTSTDDIDMELAGLIACAERDALPDEDGAAPVQGCDPAVLHRTDEELEDIMAKLPSRPLQNTINRWKLRTASPSMKDYIRRIRKEIDAEGPSKFFLPWNLRDTINVKKERQLAQGPFVNRQMLIQEYRLKKIRESWSKLDEQNEQ